MPETLSEDDLAKAFTLDGNDLREIRSLRTAKNRLGYAVLLTSMRCVGTFPSSSKDVPSDITSYLCAQIGIDAGTSLADYFMSKTLERHLRYIRERHGFAYFADAPHLWFGLTRWLYTECWVGNDRPGALVLQAANWLVAHNVILPGLSTLERLVGRVLERARGRAFARLANGLTTEQHSGISALFERDGDDLNCLEILRASPLKRRQSDFWTHLDRLDAVRDFDLGLMPPKGVPATHLSERPARTDHFEASLCAVLVAQGCNIGFKPIVRDDNSALRRTRLSWVAQNFIRTETLTAASVKIVSAHTKLTITQNWGDNQIASADGMRFMVPKTAIHAGPNARYFGQGRGATWYNMLSDQYSGLGATVVSSTLRDSLAILTLLLGQETELDPIQIMTDTATYSDAVFGLFWLLGYQFCPRLADIGGAQL